MRASGASSSLERGVVVDGRRARPRDARATATARTRIATTRIATTTTTTTTTTRRTRTRTRATATRVDEDDVDMDDEEDDACYTWRVGGANDLKITHLRDVYRGDAPPRARPSPFCTKS